MGQAALNVLRHQMAQADPEVVAALREQLQGALKLARQRGPYLDAVVEALCEMVLRD